MQKERRRLGEVSLYIITESDSDDFYESARIGAKHSEFTLPLGLVK